MTTLILDIETRPDPAMGVYKNDPEAFPPPPYHMVTTAAWLVMDPSNASAAFGYVQGERAVLKMVNELLAKRPRIVTWNGRGFDLPVLTVRAMRHGVVMKNLLQKAGGSDYLYRYRDDHCDLMDQVALMGAGRSASQHDVARMLGLPGKHVGSGADVCEMTPDQESSYCLDDVAQLALIYCEWRRIHGVEVEGVRDMVLDAIEREARLAPLHAAMMGRDTPTD